MMVTVTIKNWEKYNPKRDQKTYTWLKLNNNIRHDSKLFELSAAQMYAFVTVLCIHSTENKQTLTYSVHWLASQSKNRAEHIIKMLEIANKNGIIDFSHDNVVSQASKSTTPRVDKKRVEESRIEESISSKPQAVRAQGPTLGSQVWESYRIAYQKRYGIEPVRNRTTNSQAKALAERLGVENACEVARFYLSHNDSFFVRDQHPIGLCLTKAESLHTQWQRGTKVTGHMANQFAKAQTTNDAFDNVLAKLEEKEK